MMRPMKSWLNEVSARLGRSDISVMRSALSVSQNQSAPAWAKARIRSISCSSAARAGASRSVSMMALSPRGPAAPEISRYRRIIPASV
jgi:hypothetical protein